MSTAVGFVGIGTMGWPMSANVAAAGFAVTVFDIDRDRTERWAREHTGTVAHDMGAVASSCDVIVTMLPTGAEVRQAVDAMGGALRPGTVVVDMSSADPVGTRELAAELAERSVALVDAPVSGAVPRAIAATLTIMAGGEPAAIEQVGPCCRRWGTGSSRWARAATAMR